MGLNEAVGLDLLANRFKVARGDPDEVQKLAV
jgi:hypothetical protein